MTRFQSHAERAGQSVTSKRTARSVSTRTGTVPPPCAVFSTNRLRLLVEDLTRACVVSRAPRNLASRSRLELSVLLFNIDEPLAACSGKKLLRNCCKSRKSNWRAFLALAWVARQSDSRILQQLKEHSPLNAAIVLRWTNARRKGEIYSRKRRAKPLGWTMEWGQHDSSFCNKKIPGRKSIGTPRKRTLYKNLRATQSPSDRSCGINL